MLNDLIALRNKLQPTSKSNIDPLIFDYDFWTKVESLAKKQRTKSLETIKASSDHPEEEGVVLRGDVLRVSLSIGNPPNTFDKDKAIEGIVALGIDKFKVREVFTGAVSEGTPRKSYKVEEV